MKKILFAAAAALLLCAPAQAQLVSSLNGTLSSASPDVTGDITVTGGTVTSSVPTVNSTQTWNEGSTVFTGWKSDVTDTASAAGSLLMDLQVGGATRFQVTKGGMARWGSTSSTVALKPNSTILEVRLGDDSAYGNFHALNINLGTSDTTLARSGAGRVSIEGSVIPMLPDANTWAALQTFSSGLHVPDAAALLVDTNWQWYTNNTAQLFLRDNANGRQHLTFDAGASSALAGTTLHSNLIVNGTNGVQLVNNALMTWGSNDTYITGQTTTDVLTAVTAGTTRLTISSAGLVSTLGLTLPGGTLLTTSAALTNGAAAATGTLTNAPAAGNPTKWIPINDNGTTRYIPAW